MSATDYLNGKTSPRPLLAQLFGKQEPAKPVQQTAAVPLSFANEPPVPADFPRVGFCLITPERAAAWRETSPGNRRERRDKIEQYKRAIEQGRWDPAAAIIHIDKRGRLRNGHHRLKAIIDAGVPVWCVVVIGHDSDRYQAAMDDGIVRTIADKMRMICGVTVPNTLIGAVRCMLGLQAGRFDVLSLDEVLDGMEANEPTMRWLSTRFTKRYTAGTWGALAYAYPLAPEKIDEFVRQLVGIDDMPAGGAVRALDSFLRDADTAGQGNRERIVRKTLSALANFILGKQVSSLKDTDWGVRWFRAQFQE